MIGVAPRDILSPENYVAMASKCRTENQINRLHIKLECDLTPGEIFELENLSRAGLLNQAAREWLDKLESFNRELFIAPEPFLRSSIGPNVSLYRNPDHPPKNKTLLLAFSGNGRRLGLPICVFLQSLDSRVFDVVVFKKGSDKRPYLEGIEGFSDSLPRALKLIRRATSQRSFTRTITLGTSSGGFPALVTAVLFGAEAGFSICGYPPSSPPNLGLRCQLAVRRLFSRPPHMEFVYGTPVDQKNAALLQGYFGGTTRHVDVSQHNLLGALLLRGELTQFLDGLFVVKPI